MNQNKKRWGLRWSLAAALLVNFALWYAIIAVYGFLIAKPVEAPGPIEIVPDALDKWIDSLAEYECHPSICGDGSNYRRVDSNGYYSYSCLQFQRATFEQYAKKFDVAGDIYDCEIQKRLAKLMILDDEKAWSHWYTSVELRGLGKPPSLEG